MAPANGQGVPAKMSSLETLIEQPRLPRRLPSIGSDLLGLVADGDDEGRGWLQGILLFLLTEPGLTRNTLQGSIAVVQAKKGSWQDLEGVEPCLFLGKVPEASVTLTCSTHQHHHHHHRRRAGAGRHPTLDSLPFPCARTVTTGTSRYVFCRPVEGCTHV